MVLGFHHYARSLFFVYDMMGGGKGELKTTYKPYYVDTMCKKVIIMFDILLVEDDARIREIITYYFGNRQEKKYNITEAENGIYTETPAWLFITRNETSGKETRIYVNVVTGEIRTRVM